MQAIVFLVDAVVSFFCTLFLLRFTERKWATIAVVEAAGVGRPAGAYSG